MAVFAISDLHLPARQKPMDVFGAHWANHFDKISEDWRARVRNEDIVLLPGDLTWAMHLEEAMEDVRRVGELPGKKLILRGNHDYWWSAIGRVRRALPENMFAIQNDAMLLDGILFAGTRGWTIPGADADPDDVRIYNRERLRLEMSMKAARRIDANAPIVAMLHYPPLMESAKGFSDILENYGVADCVYGHLHGASIAGAVRGLRGGVRYHQVSCDGLDFKLYLLKNYG
ncbi:MAG: metallophosphoesterase [Candidatus Faecivicinus sp.]|nr:metallophosphoesterase [Candidatus Faecivicinus sp.]